MNKKLKIIKRIVKKEFEEKSLENIEKKLEFYHQLSQSQKNEKEERKTIEEFETEFELNNEMNKLNREDGRHEINNTKIIELKKVNPFSSIINLDTILKEEKRELIIDQMDHIFGLRNVGNSCSKLYLIDLNNIDS